MTKIKDEETKKQLGEILELLPRQKKLTISYIVRNLGISFLKGRDMFEYLKEAGCVSEEGKINFSKVSEAYFRLTKKKYPLKIYKIIFLDVDGVLNCHSTKELCGPYKGIDHSKVTLLKWLVNETQAEIVLTSSWKDHWFRLPKLKDEQDMMADYLDHKLAIQNVYITAKTDEDDPFQRGKGILDYLDRLKRKGIIVDKFVILDDCLFDYKETKLTKHLVRTSYDKEGLTKRHVIKAKELLC